MYKKGFDTSLMLSLMDTEVSLVIKVLWKCISLIYTFEYIWKWMYIRTQRALAVGVSEIRLFKEET